MRFLKSHWSNILFIGFIALLLIPQTRRPIQIGMNRLLAFSPSEVSQAERRKISSYEWELKDLRGGKLNFEEAKGEVVLINVWATWCPPCIAEMPSLAALHESYGDRVKFYFVSGEEQEKLQNFLREKDYSLPVFKPVSAPPESLEASSLPTTYLISKRGEVVIEKIGAADWDSEKVKDIIDRLLLE